jgi:hypothetical protein
LDYWRLISLLVHFINVTDRAEACLEGKVKGKSQKAKGKRQKAKVKKLELSLSLFVSDSPFQGYRLLQLQNTCVFANPDY